MFHPDSIATALLNPFPVFDEAVDDSRRLETGPHLDDTDDDDGFRTCFLFSSLERRKPPHGAALLFSLPSLDNHETIRIGTVVLL